MQNDAVYYYKHGYNCSQCMLKAAEKNIGSLPQECYDMCSGISNGFGIGGMCSVIIAGMMIFGLMYDDEEARRMRIQFLDECMSTFGSLNCMAMRKRNGRNGRCDALIEDLTGLIDDLLEEKGV